jgi:DNA-binding CsgD family transcriptional regulator
MTPGEALLLARRVARRVSRDTPISWAEDYEGLAAMAILDSGTDDIPLAWVVAKRSIIDQFRRDHGRGGSARGDAKPSVEFDEEAYRVDARSPIAAMADKEFDLQAARLLVDRFPTRLSRREVDVVALIAEGQPRDEIARELGIGRETVVTHIAKLRRKLGARSLAHAVALAIALGEIDTPRIEPSPPPD